MSFVSWPVLILFVAPALLGVLGIVEDFLVGMVISPIAMRRINVNAPYCREYLVQVIVRMVILERFCIISLTRISFVLLVGHIEHVLRVAYRRRFTSAPHRCSARTALYEFYSGVRSQRFFSIFPTRLYVTTV